MTSLSWPTCFKTSLLKRLRQIASLRSFRYSWLFKRLIPEHIYRAVNTNNQWVKSVDLSVVCTLPYTYKSRPVSWCTLSYTYRSRPVNWCTSSYTYRSRPLSWCTRSYSYRSRPVSWCTYAYRCSRAVLHGVQYRRTRSTICKVRTELFAWWPLYSRLPSFWSTP